MVDPLKVHIFKKLSENFELIEHILRLKLYSNEYEKRILAYLLENNEEKLFPIQTATSKGCTEIIRILAQIMKNPNSPNPNDGWTPIQMAASKGYTEIIKILAPLTKNPNSPNPDGLTPAQMAKNNGHEDVFRIISTFIDKPMNSVSKRRRKNSPWA